MNFHFYTQNKPNYMLANVLWSLEIAFIFIGILIYSMIGILSFSDLMMKIKDLILQMNPDVHGYTPPSGQDVEAVTGAVIGIFLAFWSIWALITCK